MRKPHTKSNIDLELPLIFRVNACSKNQRTLCLLVSHQDKKVQLKIYQLFLNTWVRFGLGSPQLRLL